MSAPTLVRPARPARPPHVAGDDPPASWAGLRAELAPRPGRLANTLRLTLIALLVIAICETFRIPDASLAAYVAFFIFKSDADATVPLALLGGLAMVFGILVTVVYLAATLAEPALRLPLMAVIAFATMYLSQATALGFAAYGAGLLTVKAMTEGDNLLKGALGPDQVTDTERLGLPALAFMSPEEALVHNLLWMALAIAVAIAVVVLVDHLTGPDPERKLRTALAGRLEAAAAFCAGEAGARQRLAGYARQGTAELAAQNELAGKLKRGRYAPAFGTGVIAALWELVLVLLAFGRLPPSPDASAILRAAEPDLRAAARAIRDGTPLPAVPVPDGPAAPAPPPDRATPVGVLGERLAACLAALRAAVEAPDPGPRAAPLGGFFKPDAFTDPAYARFALKVTLAVMACYLFMNLADWSSIDSCITTCFVVALGSFGQSVHKMALRVSGALVGAAIGFATILFVMPWLEDIGQLLIVMAPVILMGAWIRTGGERTSYVGQQLAFAFMLVVLQDYGPTLHFQTGRDRVIGILVGELAFCAVFIHLWPVSVGDLVRKAAAGAVRRLGAMLKPDGGGGGRGALLAVVELLGKAQGLLADEGREPERVRAHAHLPPVIDRDVVARLQALTIPISVLAARGGEPGAAPEAGPDAYGTAVAAWLDRFGGWIADGTGAGELAASLPRPPEAGDGPASSRAAWCAVLDDELRDIVRLAGLGDPPPSDAPQVPSRP